MILREHYTSQIRPFYESDLVKIITGIRRCGKSVILKQVMNELEAAGKRCLFLDFDLRPVRAKIPNADALIAYVNDYLGDDKLYVFLDEVQNVEGWNEAARTLRLYNTSVFITGAIPSCCPGSLQRNCPDAMFPSVYGLSYTGRQRNMPNSLAAALRSAII